MSLADESEMIITQMGTHNRLENGGTTRNALCDTTPHTSNRNAFGWMNSSFIATKQFDMVGIQAIRVWRFIYIPMYSYIAYS
jgi:hypothetical protein